MQQTASLLQEAFEHYQRGNLEAAETILVKLPDHPSALHLLGVLRVREGRLDEAAEFLRRSVLIRPSEAQSQFNLGKVLNALGRHDEACQALQTAFVLDTNLVDAAFLLGKSLHAQGRVPEAVKTYRAVLGVQPAHVQATLLLGNALIDMGDLQAAQDLLTTSMDKIVEPRALASLHQTLASLLRNKRPDQSLMHLEKAQLLDPLLTNLDFDRALLLEDLNRFRDAEDLYKQILARNPVDAKAHNNYNDLLYRLGVEEEFLASYDTAPRTQELMLAKAEFLINTGRPREAEDCYRDALARYSDNKQAVLGLGLAQVGCGRFGEAAVTFERATTLYPESVDIYCNLAGALAQSSDPQKAMAMSQKALAIDPYNQVALALLGTSLRLMNDWRDEILNGYDDFIQVFDLTPPGGYSDMTSFNAELSVYLETMHPPVREYLRQSLRGGTQTRNSIFEAGSALIEKLQIRISEAISRYIDTLRGDEGHPFLSRKGSSFRFAGSWSSRLRDQGFHINHLHPGGWISSCYYVDLPEVVNDETNRQGWIKFGQPSFEVSLPFRRVIQPAIGRLILFPSYMWHGTVPFRSSHARTTIAFDVLPNSRE